MFVLEVHCCQPSLQYLARGVSWRVPKNISRCEDIPKVKFLIMFREFVFWRPCIMTWVVSQWEWKNKSRCED
ncbi:sugar transporter [Aspergillus luchuensis]|uniref:Sugar transporter n=1 Tax=Aspergillus kawachii TaxID=1069201 RepID=A0A146FPA6_ASPKA|nr:sugar transporter [Aspergillus luchuensis]